MCHFALALKFAKLPPQAKQHTANAFAIRFSVKIRKACGECKAFARGLRPPFGGKGRGERKRGEGGRDLPRGALARSASPPFPPPPPGSQEPHRKSLSLFFFLLFLSLLFRLNSSSAGIVVRALSTFTFTFSHVSLSLNVLLL